MQWINDAAYDWKEEGRSEVLGMRCLFSVSPEGRRSTSPREVRKGVGEKMKHPDEPTGDQCNANTRLPDFGEMKCYACWYPQMGGYCGKCVVAVYDDPMGEGCFEAFVWHDGEFPFRDEEPREIHHCSPDQFIEFGELVKSLQKGPKSGT